MPRRRPQSLSCPSRSTAGVGVVQILAHCGSEAAAITENRTQRVSSGPQARRNRPWWGIRGRFRFFAESPGSEGLLVKVSSAEWVRRWRRPRRTEGPHSCVDADSEYGHGGHPGVVVSHRGLGQRVHSAGRSSDGPISRYTQNGQTGLAALGTLGPGMPCGRAPGAYSYQRSVQSGHHRKLSSHIDQL